MIEPDPGAPGDPEAVQGLLRAFVEAPEAISEQLLARLLVEHAGPVVDRVLRAKLRGNNGDVSRNGDADLRAEALAQVLARLRTLRTDAGVAAIRDFPAYVAVLTRNVVHEHLRRASPERERLRRRLWQLLSRDPRFGLWRSEGGAWVCAAVPANEAAASGAARDELAGRLEALLRRQLSPIAFSRVLTELYDQQQPSAATAGSGALDALEELADDEPDALSQLTSRSALAALWEEVQALPTRQAWVLLLGLRDGRGQSALLLLPATGTASLRQIARTLDLTPERFSMLWKELPLEDREIAEQLGVTRQQVINLRKSARERLARRMARRGHAL